MGVYIKGMKKPKDCNACFLDIYDRQTYCRNGEKALCPLIEVKAPHGRLIDADKQFRGLQKQVMALYSEKSEKYSYLMDVLDSINREPTVLDKEKRANDEALSTTHRLG